jgi:hypothetical protein
MARPRARAHSLPFRDEARDQPPMPARPHRDPGRAAAGVRQCPATAGRSNDRAGEPCAIRSASDEFEGRDPEAHAMMMIPGGRALGIRWSGESGGRDPSVDPRLDRTDRGRHPPDAHIVRGRLPRHAVTP